MSSLPASPTTALASHAGRATAPAQAPAMPMANVDPVKLIQKYKWALLASLIVGGAIGVGSHYALLKYYPRWRPFALFQAEPPVAQVRDMIANVANTDEMNRFMQTQAKIMVSDDILSRAVEDPTIQSEAPNWCKKFNKLDPTTGTMRFSTVDAARDLADDIEARVIPQTNLIQLAMPYYKRDDAVAIVGLVRQKYMQMLKDQGQVRFNDMLGALSRQIDGVDREIKTVQTKRDTLIREKQLDDVDNRVDSTRGQLQLLNGDLIKLQTDLDQARKISEQLQRERNSPAGPTFGDDLRSSVERDPIIVDIQGRIAQMEAQLDGLKGQVGPDSRTYKQLEAQVNGERNNLEIKRQAAMQKLFDGQLDSSRKSVEQLEVTESRMLKERTTLQTRLVELTSAQEQVTDFKAQLETAVEQKNELQKQLQSITAVTLLDSANRVIMQQAERRPSLPDFPKIKILVPAGMILGLGLTAAALFLRELIDQRVKGPSDITIMPRTRLLGFVPDASEDPSGKGAPETAFRDRPKGVVAESYRQLRGSLLKRIATADHRTILVMSGMPDAGSTSVVANLGFALAAADRKVLLIDANFRRPALHRVMGLPETPGLADALSGSRDFKGMVQATSTPNLDLLSAGTREQRIYERLSAPSMAELLAKARAAYDIVLIDVAPAVVAGDGMSLAQKCDASMLVVRALSEKRGMVARVKNELSDARAEMLGIVVNAVRHAAGGYLKGNIKTASEYQEK